MELKSPSRRWTEVAIVIVILGLVSALAAINMRAERHLMHQKALFFELQILRNSINLYKVVNSKNPSSLLALVTEVYELKNGSGASITHRYLDGSPVDPDGSVRDPFGQAYQYDEKTGWLRSSSQGYEFW